jgi:vacuolar-type H+-ATPase subunit H
MQSLSLFDSADKKILPEHIKIIDSGEAVAKQTHNKDKVGFSTAIINLFLYE